MTLTPLSPLAQPKFGSSRKTVVVIGLSARTLAFTLIELLVVIAIVAVIAAILFPVFARARKQAYVAQELSQLKQLGIAHAIYKGDWDDREPGSSVPIIASGVDKRLVHLPLDPYPKGWANENRYPDGFESPTSYPDSFQTLKSSAGEQFFEQFVEAQGGGWLISAGGMESRTSDQLIFGSSAYKRLTFAGSVVRRRFSDPINQSPVRGIYADRFFADEIVIPNTK
jgi:prepilin-type N-terminal cleavage/methylation domain-containing protein